jgi:hypothetical protein
VESLEAGVTDALLIGIGFQAQPTDIAHILVGF